MENQTWFCKTCNKRGTIEYEANTDFYLVFNKIREAHSQFMTRDCNFGNVQIVNLEKISIEELAEVIIIPVV